MIRNLLKSVSKTGPRCSSLRNQLSGNSYSTTVKPTLTLYSKVSNNILFYLPDKVLGCIFFAKRMDLEKGIFRDFKWRKDYVIFSTQL